MSEETKSLPPELEPVVAHLRSHMLEHGEDIGEARDPTLEALTEAVRLSVAGEDELPEGITREDAVAGAIGELGALLAGIEDARVRGLRCDWLMRAAGAIRAGRQLIAAAFPQYQIAIDALARLLEELAERM